MPTISELMKTANAQAEEAKRLNEQTQALQQQQQNITAGANALHARLDALQKPVIGSQVARVRWISYRMKWWQERKRV